MAAAAVVVAGVGPVGSGTAQAAGNAELGGGSGLVFDNNSACSLTAIGYDGAGRLVGLTAGHCAPAGARLGAEKTMDAGVVGVVAYSDNGAGLDFAVLQFDPARVTPVRTVGPTTISGLGGRPAPGTTVCKSGRTSGTDCGVVWGGLEGSTINQSCSKPGDSGGPVTVGDRLVGMNQGRLTGMGGIGFDVPCVGAGNPMHSPAFFASIDQILDAVNATGGVGAGFRPL
ncbi:S1 family peptidase [Nocardia sp. KC 131]|uniref:S1 family peptidase n=1 Tax=Nocardia arseniciresistens TaxID=3392119 RepID=UPI00398ED108